MAMPQVDFSLLGDLGKTYKDAQVQAGRERSLAALGQGASIADVSRALFQSGDVQGGLSLAQLADSQALHKASIANMEAQRRLQERGLVLQERQHTPEYIESVERTKAKVAEEYAPKTTDLTLPSGEKVTVQKGPQGYVVPSVKGLPDEPSIAYPPGVDRKAYREARSKQLGNIDDKAVLEADKAVQAGGLAVQSLTRALDLNKSAYSGPFADQRGYAASLIPGQVTPGSSKQRGIDTQVLTNTVTEQALENLRATFGGNPTEGERKILLQVQGAASQAPEVREAIYRNAIELAKRRTEFNRKTADEMRSGQYLLPQGQRQDQSQQTAPQPSAPFPKEAIAALRQNPRLAEQFDDKYGAGSAARVLGVMR